MHRFACALFFDVLALGIFYYYIPRIRRPFEVMLAGVAVLAVITALSAGKGLLRSALIIVASTSFSLFALEMSQKYFDIMNLFAPARSGGRLGEGDYAWDYGKPATYLAAKAKAKRDGLDPDIVEDRFVGDIFAKQDAGRLWTRYKKDVDGGRHQHEVAFKKNYTFGPPLGYELAPDNLIRYYGTEMASGETIYDIKATIDRFGLRETRGDPESDEVYFFFGCSNTFGSNINDDETLPHFFSAAGNFEKRVVNLGVAGYGPSQALRDLQLNYHAGKMKIGKGQVKGVYYQLIDDHPRRVVTPAQDDSPYYVLEGDRAVYKGGFLEYLGRSGMLMERSRIYPILRGRLYFKMDPADLSWQWRTTIAVLAEMDGVCRERYGVPLTVIYWGTNSKVMEGIRAKNIPLLWVGDAFGSDWPAMAIKYNIFDGHASRHGNRLLGNYVYAAAVRGSSVPATDKIEENR